MGVVYKATSKTSGKSYIGLTGWTLEERKQSHYYQSATKNGKTYAFYNAIKKYGFDDFEWEVLFETEHFNELQRYECYFIGKYNSFENGYNSTIGGEGFVGVSKPKGEKNWKSKISEAQAKEVVRLLIETTLSSMEISKITEVGKSTVRNIANGSSWTHLYDTPPKEVNTSRRGVRALGENAPTAKLTESDVIKIRSLADGGEQVTEIQKQHYPQMNVSSLYAIAKRRTWKHVKEVD